jgi:hypothetical protein
VIYARESGTFESPLALLEALYSTASKNPDDKGAVNTLLQYCQAIVFYRQGWGISDYKKCIDRVACIALEFRELDLLRKCIDVIDECLPIISVGESIGAAFWSIGFPVFRLQ